MTNLVVDRDNTGVPLYMITLSDKTYSARLAADTDTTLAVPAGYSRAIISSDDYYHVKADGVITLPIEGSGFSETDAPVAMDAIRVIGITTLHFRARNACDISVSFYKG